MLLSDRWEQILELLARSNEEVSVETLTAEMRVSAATIRRDLTRMTERGLIERTHGGARCLRRIWSGPSLAESRHIHPKHKTAIGRRAASLIHPGDTLFIDGGFTTYQVACHLSARPLTVATNALDVANILYGMENISIILLGGELDTSVGATQGAMTEGAIRELHVDKAILGADAVSAAGGLATPLSGVSQLKRCMMEQAQQVIVVADHSKIGATALYGAFPAASIQGLVTYDEADTAALAALRAADVEIIIAPLDSRDEGATL